MKNQSKMLKLAVLGISVICLCAFAVTSVNAAVEKPERIIAAPSTDAGGFSFIVVGDTPNTDFNLNKNDDCYDLSAITPCNTDIFPAKRPKKDNCKKYSKEETHKLKVKFNEYFPLVLKQMAASLRGKQAPAAAQAAFAVTTGDLVYRGVDNKHWDTWKGFFGDILSKCPPRMFSVMGNRETCVVRGDADAMDNFFGAFPCQVQNGEQLHHFAFFAGNSVFINLCSGGIGSWGPKYAMYDESFNCTQNTYEQQMTWLDQVIDYGVGEKGTKHVFVQYHKPSFTNLTHYPLAACNDPVSKLEKIKADKHASLNYFVFNSHNHTTEVYRTDSGIMTMVVGGGGGPQRHLNCNAIHEKPTPEERFWKALGIPLNKRDARVNYFQVAVKDDDVKIQEICLTERDGGLSFELGATIDKNGNVTPPAKKGTGKLYPLK